MRVSAAASRVPTRSHAPLTISSQARRRLGKELKPPSRRASNERHVDEFGVDSPRRRVDIFLSVVFLSRPVTRCLKRVSGGVHEPPGGILRKSVERLTSGSTRGPAGQHLTRVYLATNGLKSIC